MILTLAVCGAAGLVAGRLLAWRAQRGRVADPAPSSEEAAPESNPPEAEAPGDAPAATHAQVRLEGFPCQLGDVVLLPTGEEAWLAGALLLSERTTQADGTGAFQRTVAVLFVAPDKGSGRAVYARPAPDPALDWMSPLSPGEVTLGAEPPSSLEHDGTLFERVRRLPLGVDCAGEGAPDLGPSVILAEYDGGADARLVILATREAAHVWRGRRLAAGMFDVLPARGDR